VKILRWILWKLQPSVWHNLDSNMWHVYFENERSYTVSRRTLSVELHIGQESGKIVGLNIFDETLIAAAEAIGVSDDDEAVGVSDND